MNPDIQSAPAARGAAPHLGPLPRARKNHPLTRCLPSSLYVGRWTEGNSGIADRATSVRTRRASRAAGGDLHLFPKCFVQTAEHRRRLSRGQTYPFSVPVFVTGQMMSHLRRCGCGWSFHGVRCPRLRISVVNGWSQLGLRCSCDRCCRRPLPGRLRRKRRRR